MDLSFRLFPILVYRWYRIMRSGSRVCTGIICYVTSLLFHKILHGNRKVVLIIASAMIFLASCRSLSGTSDSYISKQQAIDAALEIALTSHPEISGAQVTPSNIRVEQMTLDEAVKHINPTNDVAASYDPTMTVWFVTMEGLWLGEMPAPGVSPTPEPVPYHHYAIILDAKTGLEIESSLSP